jgi:hypothetical protein
LGVGDTADRLAPTRVMGIQDDIVQLSAGCVSSAALTGKVLFTQIQQCCHIQTQLEIYHIAHRTHHVQDKILQSHI